MKWWWFLSLLWPFAAQADETVSVCYNYGCQAQADVRYSEAQLAEVRQTLLAASNAAQEREVIGRVIGQLLGWAGEQSPIKADRGGNYADGDVSGKMDCIDHSTTTTRLLKMLDARGLLRFHRVLEPALRHRFLIFDHFAALIEEKNGGENGAAPAARFVVDSWFFDNGHPAAVLPLAYWMSGGGPESDE